MSEMVPGTSKVLCEQEYIGFTYRIMERDTGEHYALPASGQHPTAAKLAHRMAVIEIWQAECARDRKGNK